MGRQNNGGGGVLMILTLLGLGLVVLVVFIFVNVIRCESLVLFDVKGDTDEEKIHEGLDVDVEVEVFIMDSLVEDRLGDLLREEVDEEEGKGIYDEVFKFEFNEGVTLFEEDCDEVVEEINLL